MIPRHLVPEGNRCRRLVEKYTQYYRWKNGKIKFEDTEIEKIMIDSDNFFNKGYILLSKNMLSEPLDKIEVLQKYSNNKLLKGIENSNKVALS